MFEVNEVGLIQVIDGKEDEPIDVFPLPKADKCAGLGYYRTYGLPNCASGCPVT